MQSNKEQRGHKKSAVAALGCDLNGSTQHSLEAEHPGLRARRFYRRVVRAGAASIADGRTDISKSQFAMEPPSKQATGLSVGQGSQHFHRQALGVPLKL